MRLSRNALAALLAIALPAAPLAAQTLTPYDVFVFHDFTFSLSEVNGRLAVGGNATLTNWRVGHLLTPGYTDFSLVVGGNLNSNNGSVARGQTYVGGTFTGNGTTGFPAAYPAPVGGLSTTAAGAGGAESSSAPALPRINGLGRASTN